MERRPRQCRRELRELTVSEHVVGDVARDTRRQQADHAACERHIPGKAQDDPLLRKRSADGDVRVEGRVGAEQLLSQVVAWRLQATMIHQHHSTVCVCKAYEGAIFTVGKLLAPG